MHQRQRRHRAWVRQVGIVATQLGAGQQALVDHAAPIERAQVEVVVSEPRLARGSLDRAAQQVEAGVEGGGVHVVGRFDEELAHPRLADLGAVTEVGVANRHRAPGQQSQRIRGDSILDQPLQAVAEGIVARQEGLSDAVARGRRQAGHFGRKQPVGLLDQHARAVAGVLFRASGTAVIEVFQGLEGEFDDLVTGAPGEIGDRADTAVGVDPGRIVQADAARRSDHGRPRWDGGRRADDGPVQGNRRACDAGPDTGRGIVGRNEPSMSQG